MQDTRFANINKLSKNQLRLHDNDFIFTINFIPKKNASVLRPKKIDKKFRLLQYRSYLGEHDLLSLDCVQGL